MTDLYVIDVYVDLDGEAEVTSIDPFDLLAYISEPQGEDEPVDEPKDDPAEEPKEDTDSSLKTGAAALLLGTVGIAAAVGDGL